MKQYHNFKLHKTKQQVFNLLNSMKKPFVFIRAKSFGNKSSREGYSDSVKESFI